MEFWIIRWSNTWQTVSFEAHIPALAAESLDAVELILPAGLLGPTTVKGMAEEVIYDSNNLSAQFKVWTPIRLGETTQYPYAWTQQEYIMAGNIGNPNDAGWAVPGNPIEGFEGLDYDAQELAEKASQILDNINLQSDARTDFNIANRETCVAYITEKIELDNGEVEYKGSELIYAEPAQDYAEAENGILFDSDCTVCEPNFIEINGDKTSEVNDKQLHIPVK